MAPAAIRPAPIHTFQPRPSRLLPELSCPAVTLYLALGAAIVVVVLFVALRRVVISALRSAAAHFWPH